MTTATLVLTAGAVKKRSRREGRAEALFSNTDDWRDPADPQRFAAFVTRYQSRVHRLVAGILGPAYAREAEDATQEVFLLAYRKIESFRGDSRLSTWLYRLAYNRAIDYRRKLDRRREEAAPPEEEAIAAATRSVTTPLGSALARERETTMQRELERLQPKQRAAVHLHYWLGCTVAEIAELMDAKPATVKSYLFRARKALAQSLGLEGDDE